MRTGSVKTRVPDKVLPLWRVEVGSSVSPPIVVGDCLLVSAIDEHHVICLDVSDGRKLWEFAAGGRVDSPPTYHKGTVVFGSTDGWVYCLRAADGQLVWRFRGAPAERMIGAFGQLESAWPVHGSVLVQNDTVYFAAGRSSQLDDGIFVYGIDAATGELRHQTNLEGPHYMVGDIEENYKLPMGALPDVLMSDGSEIYMRSKAFDATLRPANGEPALRKRSSFLDDSYFKRMQWMYGDNHNYGRLIVHDRRSVYFVRMFDSLRGLDPTVFFTPGGKGYLLFAQNMKGGKDTWKQRVPVRIRAMALTEDRLFVAGPPDVMAPDDPLGAFENRKGGLLYVIDSESGDKLAEHKLPSPPVFNAAAAANGRLYIADEHGHVTCFGQR
jgi:outer membrane protein assembly factor BamB